MKVTAVTLASGDSRLFSRSRKVKEGNPTKLVTADRTGASSTNVEVSSVAFARHAPEEPSTTTIMTTTTATGIFSAAAETAGDEESRLIAASRDGDSDAFSTLVKLHERRVWRLAGRFFRQAEDIEDAAQETFVTAWQKLHTYRGRAPFEHWLTRVCLNCCYGRLRKRRTNELALDPSFDPVAPSGDPNARLETEALLRRLPARDRFILLLLDGEGYSTAEIAERLGWTRVNVKVRAHRARKRLRRLLEASS